MAKYLSTIRATVRQFLQDEFVSGSDYKFPDDELDLCIDDCLVEISLSKPYEVKETLTTTANSKELDISSIENLLEVEKIEFRTGQDPLDYRNCSVFGNILTMDIDFNPSASEDVYLYCHKVHQLTETSSTLSPQLEKVLIDGAVAKAASNWSNQIRKQITAAISSVSEVNTAVDSMSARITQAISDLTAGRAKIGYKVTEANTAIGNMTARITAAIDDLTSGRALIGDKKTQAITALDAVSGQITQAVNDLTSGRAQIDDARTLADTAIDNMSARITQAQTDLTNGRDLINKVNIGGQPENDYVNYAGRELSIAADYLNQAKGYLGEGTTADRYQVYAARDLQAAADYINQARGYLALDVVTGEYGNYAARELANANQYLAQAKGYLAMDAEVSPYALYAAREVTNATAYLNQSGGYIRELTSRLNIVKAASSYQAWADNRLVLYERALRRISPPKTNKQYPKS